MFYDEQSADILQQLNSSKSGLSDSEAQKRLSQYGRNELVDKKPRSKILLFLAQFNSFIVYILIAATVVSLIVGEYIDSLAIFIILILNAVFGFVQENKAENAIAALKKMATLKAKVNRDGKLVMVDASEVVPGDILVIDTGDKIAADSRIIDCSNLETQEGSLTGESLPVRKSSNPISGKLMLGDQKNMLFSGTVVTKGRGLAVIVRTGMNSEIGKIAGMIQEVEEEETPLQKKLEKLGHTLGYLTLVVCGIVFLSGLLRHEPVLQFFIVSVALAVAVIPEGLPAVVTISLALGVQRMIKRNALVRNLPSVETLGATTVICTDKTGTLTKNEMTVTKLYTNDKVFDVTGTGYDKKGQILQNGMPAELTDVQYLLRIGVLNNDAALSEADVIGDPTEASLLVSAAKQGLEKMSLEKDYPRFDEIPFDSERKCMITMHSHADKNVAYIKGAPEVVLQRCTRILEKGGARILSEDDKDKILAQYRDFAKQALRVLGFAYKNYDSKFTEDEMVFVGLQAMIDPPRPEVKKAIQECYDAGIRVVMVTGDFEETAKAIAKEIGLVGRAISGADIDRIKDLAKEVEDVAIVSRVNPEHKIRIVEALQQNGHIVAMTGDGVNDAPALKKAHIGIAMGIKGTDVAKESSAMILTDDNFASIVHAIEEGRGIDDNIKKFVNYLMSCNFGELLVLFIAMLIGFRDSNGLIVIPLVAVQLLWVNLVTDGLPALALGVDPIDPDVMDRKPRDPKANIISKNMMLNIFVTGALICAATLGIFVFGLRDSPVKAQTLAFTTIVFLEMARVQIIRQQYHTKLFANHFLLWAVGISVAAQLFVVYSPLHLVFDTVPLSWADMGAVLAVCAGVYILGTAAAKIVQSVTRERD